MNEIIISKRGLSISKMPKRILFILQIADTKYILVNLLRVIEYAESIRYNNRENVLVFNEFSL